MNHEEESLWSDSVIRQNFHERDGVVPHPTLWSSSVLGRNGTGNFLAGIEGRTRRQIRDMTEYIGRSKGLSSKNARKGAEKAGQAHEVLCNPWDPIDGVAPDKPIDSAVLSLLKQFSAMNKFVILWLAILILHLVILHIM